MKTIIRQVRRLWQGDPLYAFRHIRFADFGQPHWATYYIPSRWAGGWRRIDVRTVSMS